MGLLGAQRDAHASDSRKYQPRAVLLLLHLLQETGPNYLHRAPQPLSLLGVFSRLGSCPSCQVCLLSGLVHSAALLRGLPEFPVGPASAASSLLLLYFVRLPAVFQEKQMTCTDINTLTRQKELLLQKLSTFEETNRTLRDLLREQHCKEVSSGQASRTPARPRSPRLLVCEKKTLLVRDLRGP